MKQIKWHQLLQDYKEKKISSIEGTESNFNEIKKIISRKDNIIFLGAGFSSSIAEEFKNFIEKNEKLTNKDLEKDENKSHITKSLDLHGYTLDEANKKVESFITECFDQKVSKVIIVTGKGLHSQNDKDPYISKKFGILKNSVPDFIKNNSIDWLFIIGWSQIAKNNVLNSSKFGVTSGTCAA